VRCLASFFARVPENRPHVRSLPDRRVPGRRRTVRAGARRRRAVPVQLPLHVQRLAGRVHRGPIHHQPRPGRRRLDGALDVRDADAGDRRVVPPTQAGPHDAVATAMPWNKVIGTDSVVTFGWTAIAPATEVPTDITVNGLPC